MTAEIHRAAPELLSFIEFCHANPSLRFWQALLAWSQEAYDWDTSKSVAKPPDRIEFLWHGYPHVAYPETDDTFYYEWAGPNPIGPERKA